MMVVNKVVRNIGRRGRGVNMFSGIKKMRGAAGLATSGLVFRSLNIKNNVLAGYQDLYNFCPV